MDNQRTPDRSIDIAVEPPTPFEEEQRELMQRRLRLICFLGVVIAGVVHLFYVSVIGRPATVITPFTPYVAVVYDLHVASFGVAALLVYARNWSLRVLVSIDLTLFTFNILLTHFFAVVFDLYKVPVFAVSMLLFLHASFVPVRVSAQAALAAVGALGFAVAASLGYALIPGIQEFWRAADGLTAFRATLVEGTFLLGLLAIVSVTITKALYHMRLSLHKARRLGNYIIERELGEGGMGQVYIAQHALIRRPTALKVMKAAPDEEDSYLARFEREVRLSATLTHPNTITIYDFGRTGRDTFYYAMEYLEGLNLEQLVDHFGPVRPERVVFILTQVCGSLAEAHDKGIVHRDIKPSNILLSHRGGLYDFVKVLDFGLAKQFKLDEATSVTRTGVLLGTPMYVAPEAARTPDRVDGRADLYCLGAVAYWMLVGRPPFEAASSLEVIAEHIKERPLPPAEVSELAIPWELNQVVMRCLEKDPEDRFQAAREMGAALRGISFELPWTHERAREWWALHSLE
ncbi:MAG: serine/threonine protein kinase [Gemmatimonadota bacterium]|nr:MAG: serine/threonine protein kinase [Gemmatimonadota bacterium]